MFKAVVFDWAGTMVDFGSFAPMGAFVRTFGQFKVEVTIDEARAPMGLPKLENIRAMLAQPRIAAAWAKARSPKATPKRRDRTLMPTPTRRPIPLSLFKVSAFRT